MILKAQVILMGWMGMVMAFRVRGCREKIKNSSEKNPRRKYMEGIMGKKLKLILFIPCMLSFLLVGCASIKPLPSSPKAKTKHIYEKNYELGERQNVNVGESVIRVKDYYLKKKKKSAMSPNKDFITSGGRVTIKGHAGNTYPLIGIVDYKNNQLKVLKIKDTEGHYKGLIVTSQGHVGEKVLNRIDSPNPPIYMVYKFTTEPSNVEFTRSTEEEIESKSGYTNYKIIYTGQTEKSITLSYREFTPENLARPAFTQKLSYSKSSDMIQFKDLKIKIHYSTNQRIEYSVLEDGYSP